ncbi:uncharacterized protein N7477_001822 [Penicillium maclennaniae]|uniref:uncharacterized protein n=1 Tax=Penicillium maclennaniae TaxID=1343394 RepID=UPI002541C0A8|nr:uncharacterized protein N7477_001822 [Penicillium maclennaniae]KAJ5681882.1 hypothetical protein N7477_001822 [Penicillium maclennaniae]
MATQHTFLASRKHAPPRPILTCNLTAFRTAPDITRPRYEFVWCNNLLTPTISTYDYDTTNDPNNTTTEYAPQSGFLSSASATMARAAVLPPSPVKRGARTAPRTTLTKTTASTAAKKKAPARMPVKSATLSDTDDTEDELGMMMKEQQKPGRPRGNSAARPAARPATKATARGKKSTPPAQEEALAGLDDESGAAKAEPPKKRVGRPRKNPLPEEPAVAKLEAAPKPRGRPKGSQNTSKPTTTCKTTRKATEAENTSDELGPTKIIINPNAIRSNLLRGPAKKKTVTFQDPTDSGVDEEVKPAASTAGRKKAATKDAGKTGLGSTPVRKNSAVTGRGRKPAAAKKDDSQPLSPKKAKQVAKSLSAYASSDGEEDELSAAKDDSRSPIRLLVHSPAKDITERVGMASPVRKINFTPKKTPTIIDENGDLKFPTPKHGSSTTGLSSPVRRINFTPNHSRNAVADNGHLALPPGKSIDFSDSVFMSSPARRPEASPSPFKFSLRDTPNGGFSHSVPAPNFTPGRESPLKMSPRKGHLAASFSGTPSKAATPLFQAQSSLIQSPAKRIASPFKTSLFSSKATIREENADTFAGSAMKARKFASPSKDFQPFGGDEDLDMVEEVARDIFGIELQSDRKSSSASPFLNESPKTEPVEDVAATPAKAAEDEAMSEYSDENVEPVPEHRSTHNEAAEYDVMSGSEDADIDEKLEELQEEIRREPEDMGTFCFNTMEELQEPFQNLEQPRIFDFAVDSDEVDPNEESAVQDQGEREPIFGNANLSFSAFRTHTRTGRSRGTANVPIGSRGLASTGENEQHEDYIASIRYPDEEQEMESEQEDIPDNDFTFAQSEIAFSVTPQPRSPFQQDSTYQQMYEDEQITSPFQIMQSVPPLAPTPLAGEMTPVSIRQEEAQASVKSIDRLFDINYSPRPLAQESPFDTTQTEILSPVAPSVSNTPRVQNNRKSVAGVDLGFTPLAERFDNWDTNIAIQERTPRPRRRGVFSLVGPLDKATEINPPAQEDDVSYPDLSRTPLTNTPSLFTDLPLRLSVSPTRSPARSSLAEHDPEMIESPGKSDIYEDEESVVLENEEIKQVEQQEETAAHESSDNEAMDSSDEDKENLDTAPPAPATPVRPVPGQSRMVHTVSKVPLKAEGDLPRKRGHSLASASPTRSSPRISKPIFPQLTCSMPSFSPHNAPRMCRSPSPKRRCSAPRRSSGKVTDVTPTKAPSVAASPAKTPRPNFNPSSQALRGAVVHVDVHTTEGEDASGIFLELLQQMGARCVKSWSWNPRASLSPADDADSKEANSKVGITHVVYKDGGLRTLEKVKHAAGLVKCVGVNWVLDCERENKWLEETPYTVDCSIVPRGGAKRRKSMEPRALSNVNGTLVHTAEPSTPSASGRRHGANLGAIETFRKITPPTPVQVPSTPEQSNDRYAIPQTPGYNFANLDAIGMSPATPYFLSNRNKLVQQSCPPKQSQRGLFSAGKPSTRRGLFDVDDDERRKQRTRMEAARRKTNLFKPSAESPLKR